MICKKKALATILAAPLVGLFTNADAGAAPTSGDNMTNQHSAPETEKRAISLDVRLEGDQVIARILGQTDTARRVSFTLEVSGSSTSRHKSSSTIAPGPQSVLSSVAISRGDDWCVRALVEEEGLDPYELSEGPC